MCFLGVHRLCEIYVHSLQQQGQLFWHRERRNCHFKEDLGGFQPFKLSASKSGFFQRRLDNTNTNSLSHV